MRTFIALLCVLSAAVGTLAAQWTTTYVANTNLMLNQERGTYVMNTYQSSSWSSVGAATIASWKTQYYNTLILAEITFNTFKSTPLSTAIIANIATEFQLYRSCGIKAIVRFVYNNDMAASAPWGDASSAAVVFNHIAQLTPTLQANQDVIAYVQAGFVGLWGEWYYTDAFGDQGQTSAQNIADRKKVHELLLAAVPQRTVQLRTPAWMKTFYGTTPSAAIGTTNLQRTGTHNDCFLASSTDQGTYTNYATDYAYLSAQTKYTGAIFETCAVSTRSVCATALNEIAGLHMVSGHRLYNTDVWNQWISGGCYNQILLTLGHRLTFVSGAFDVQTAVGSSFSASVTIKNTGVAAPINSRKTEFILRKVDDGQICVATVPIDSKTMQGGTTFTVTSKIRLPANIAQGRWEVLMHFADPYSTLYGVPWYKIQAANNNIYESGTGLHKLNSILDVLSGATNAVVAGEVPAICGMSLSSIVNTTVTTGDTSCLGGYYKVGSTCTMCPAGYACASATSSPVACASGTWSSGGQRTCTACTSCSSKGTCQAKTGACLCTAGQSGFDCSLSTSTTPVTASPTSGGNTVPPVTLPPATKAGATTLPPVTKPAVTTAAPATSSGGAVSPDSTTACTGAKNLLVNPQLKAVASTIAGWTGNYVPTTANGQPSANLYIPLGTVGMVKTMSQTVTFTTPTMHMISFGAYVQSWLISGVLDWDYMLYISLAYSDGTTATLGVRAPVPSSGWTWLSSSFQPTKNVAAVTLILLMQTHTGSSWITGPVLTLAPACAVTNPAGTGGVVLSAESSSTGLSDSVLLGIYIAAGAVALMIAAGVGVYCYRKRGATLAVDAAVATQMTAV